MCVTKIVAKVVLQPSQLEWHLWWAFVERTLGGLLKIKNIWGHNFLIFWVFLRRCLTSPQILWTDQVNCFTHFNILSSSIHCSVILEYFCSTQRLIRLFMNKQSPELLNIHGHFRHGWPAELTLFQSMSLLRDNHLKFLCSVSRVAASH